MVADLAAYSVRTGSLLSAHTLVLNRNWVAVGVTRAKRAISLVYIDSAKVLSPETYALHDFNSWTELSEEAPSETCIHSVRFAFRVPEIILLTRYGGVPRAGVAFSRRNLCIRDKYTCQFCGRRLDGNSLTIDHVLPRSRGGKATWDNCVLACVACNERKGSRTPEEAGMHLKKPPRRPAWSPSFSVPVTHRLPSWRRFLGDTLWDADGYWDVELEP